MPSVPAIDAPLDQDLTICQGSDFKIDLTFQTDSGAAIGDLTGCTVAAKIRADFNPSSALIVAMTASVIDGPNATIRLALTAAQTAALSRPAGVSDSVRLTGLGFYDAEINDGTYTYRYAQGSVTLSAEVTR